MRWSTRVGSRRLSTIGAWLVAALGVLAGSDMALRAAEPEPIAVLSLGSPEHLLADVQFLAELGGFPMLATAVGEQLRGLTEVDQLEGIDLRRPLGAMVGSDGLLVYSLAFVPVTDTARLLESLRKPLGEVAAVRPGLWKIGQGPATAYVREHNGWAFLAQREETLRAPPDPAAVLGQLPQQYDVALRLNLDRVPEQFTTLAVDALRLLLRRDLERHADEPLPQQRVRRTLATWEFLAYEHLLTDSQQVTFGWALQRDSRRMLLDVELVPRSGSALQAVLRGLRDAPQGVPLAGSNECGLHAHCRLALDETLATTLHRELDALRGPLLESGEQQRAPTGGEDSTASGGNGEPQPRVAAALMGCLLDACQASLASRQFEVALSVSGQQPPWTVIGRAHIGRDAAGTVLAQLRHVARQFPQEMHWDTDQAAVANHEVHVLTLSSEAAQTLSPWLGPRWKVYALGHDEHVWVAAGPQALALLRQAVRDVADASQPADRAVVGTDGATTDAAAGNGGAALDRGATAFRAAAGDSAGAPWPRAPIVIRVRASALARWLTAGDSKLGRLLSGLGASLASSDDTLQLTATVVDDTLRVRCEAREGVLRAAVALTALRWLLGP
jgi:hypothetical protein